MASRSATLRGDDMPIALATLFRTIGIRGFISIGLGLALAFVMWRADSLSDRLAKSEEWASDVTSATRLASGVDKLPREKVAQQIMFLGEGVNTLKGEIDKLNLEANARADAYQTSLKLAQKDAERLKRQSVASQGQIDRLHALAASQGNTCEVSGELADTLEGL